MLLEFNIDANHVGLGDDSVLSLRLNREKKESLVDLLSGPNARGSHLLLEFDRMADNKKPQYVSFKIDYHAESNTLRLATPPFAELIGRLGSSFFREVTVSSARFNQEDPAKASELRVTWKIRNWTEPGAYIVNGFFVTPLDDFATDPNGESRGGNALLLSEALMNLGFAERQEFGQSIRLRVEEDQATEPVKVSLQAAQREETPDQALWRLIRTRTVDFNKYREFIDGVLCLKPNQNPGNGFNSYPNQRYLSFNRVASYNLLKYATEFYLMQEVGLALNPKDGFDQHQKLIQQVEDGGFGEGEVRGARGQEAGRTGGYVTTLRELRDHYLEDLENQDGKVLPYFKLIREKLSEVPLKKPNELPFADYNLTYGILKSKLTDPPLMELLWSYWHEEGGLVQTMNALSLRFQNVRRASPGPDPLANFNLDPLRPLNNIIWGYIEDERNRLTLNRRNLEYQYEYGISLIGRAVQDIPVAEHRTHFLRGFHSLLRACVEFYQQANFTTVIPDGFGIRNYLREVHMSLAEGAHNQYGDLPWTARTEMLTQQWILARPEVREFLGGRIMVPYTEPWMDRVDNMKQLQGWNSVNITHFRDLGVLGEQLLLSIRYGSWNDPNVTTQNAANWALYWREEVQRYIHAYKAVTGVDLASDIVDARIAVPASEDRYQMPAQLIERQVALQQTATNGAGQLAPQLAGPLANGRALAGANGNGVPLRPPARAGSGLPQPLRRSGGNGG